MIDDPIESSNDVGAERIDSGPAASQAAPRRSFLKKALATLLGAMAGLAAAAPAVMVLVDPLRRTKKNSDFVRVTTLETLDQNGEPRKFPIIKSSNDAWSHYPEKPVGAVYLRRSPEDSVEAFNAVCPHAGCFVSFRSGDEAYRCPCHDSSFALDGSIRDPDSPSPRGLDSLNVEIRNQNEVWVEFQNFRAGTPKKIPVS